MTPALPRAKRAAISTRASAVEFVQIAEEAATKVGTDYISFAACK